MYISTRIVGEDKRNLVSKPSESRVEEWCEEVQVLKVRGRVLHRNMDPDYPIDTACIVKNCNCLPFSNWDVVLLNSPQRLDLLHVLLPKKPTTWQWIMNV